jgi:hypothetical protein
MTAQQRRIWLMHPMTALQDPRDHHGTTPGPVSCLQVPSRRTGLSITSGLASLPSSPCEFLDLAHLLWSLVAPHFPRYHTVAAMILAPNVGGAAIQLLVSYDQ